MTECHLKRGVFLCLSLEQHYKLRKLAGTSFSKLISIKNKYCSVALTVLH